MRKTFCACMPLLVALVCVVAPPVSATGVFIDDVPAYIWQNGCAPTATGMVVGFYATHGYGELVNGNAAIQNKNLDYLNFYSEDYLDPVNNMISSLANYSDYCAPRDDGGPVVPDRSTTNPANTHAGNSLADFMFTSQSARGLTYGYTNFMDVSGGFVDYVNWASNGGYLGSARAYYDQSFLWDYYRGEIDLDHPVVLEVDSNADGLGDHMVCAVGYQQIGAGQWQYAYYNTWDRNLRWADCRLAGVGVDYGVAGGVYFEMSSVPEPSSMVAVLGGLVGFLGIRRRRA